jgi:hypothetical protein
MTKKAEVTEQPVVAFKGFDKNLVCHPPSGKRVQYEVGQSYEHKGSVVRCAEGGFHACENPLDVFGYYAPGESRFCIVEMSGEIARDDEDTKIAAGKIHVKAELMLPDLIGRAFAYVVSKCNPATSKHTDEDRSASSATGYSSASSATGYRSASSATGYRSASSATGYRSASSATGDSSASSATGDRSASSATGDRSASSATGDRSASSATGYSSASSATGYSSASSATGDSSASSATGYSSASMTTGWASRSEIAPADKPQHAVAIAVGGESRARAPQESAIVLAYRNERGELLHIRASKVGENGVKPDTWYTLDANGEFVEAQDA